MYRVPLYPLLKIPSSRIDDQVDKSCKTRRVWSSAVSEAGRNQTVRNVQKIMDLLENVKPV